MILRRWAPLDFHTRDLPQFHSSQQDNMENLQQFE